MIAAPRPLVETSLSVDNADVAGTIDEQAVAAAHRDLVADGHIQFRLAEPPPPAPPPEWLQLLPKLAPLLEWALYAGAAVLAFVLLRAAWRWWQRRGTAPPEAEIGWRPEAGAARELLAEADRLAAAGRYGEAAHLILLRSVEQIAARDPLAVRPALTSRDIARLPGLAAPVAGAFAEIAAIVERWLFAGADAAEADWTRCRQAYAAVAG